MKGPYFWGGDGGLGDKVVDVQGGKSPIHTQSEEPPRELQLEAWATANGVLLAGCLGMESTHKVCGDASTSVLPRRRLE